jgi:hypothetical protein
MNYLLTHASTRPQIQGCSTLSTCGQREKRQRYQRDDRADATQGNAEGGSCSAVARRLPRRTAIVPIATAVGITDGTATTLVRALGAKFGRALPQPSSVSRTGRDDVARFHGEHLRSLPALRRLPWPWDPDEWIIALPHWLNAFSPRILTCVGLAGMVTRGEDAG